MSARNTIIDQYGIICALSGEILKLAEAHEWEQLVDREAGYITEVERLRDLGPAADVSGAAERQEVAKLIERTLEQDSITRSILESRQVELASLIGNSRRQQALGQAYQAGKGNIASRLRSVSTEPRS